MELVSNETGFDSRETDSCISPQIISFDDYGFAVFEELQCDFERRRCHVYKQKPDVTCKEAWEKVLSNWNNLNDTGMLHEKLAVLMKNGIADDLRSVVWSKLLAAEQMKATSQFSYEEQCTTIRSQLVDLGISEYSTSSSIRRLSEMKADDLPTKEGHLSIEVVRHIFLDLDRTFPTHRSFMGESEEAVAKRASLFRILASYAHYNINVGYCQGMSSIAGLLLMYMSEESTFWSLVSLIHRRKYQLTYFEQPMEHIQKHAAVFEHLLETTHPLLHKHLTDMGVCSLMYLPSWFLCLFTGLPCWDSVLGIWDLHILQGKKAMFCVALSILAILEDDLLAASDLSSILPLLLHPPPEKMCYKTLLATVWQVTIEDWEVASIQQMLEEAPSTGMKKRKRHESQDTWEDECVSRKRKKSDDSWLVRVRNAFRAPWRNKDVLKRGVAAKQRRQSTRLNRRHMVVKKDAENGVQSPKSPFTEISINSLSSAAAAYSFKTFHTPMPLRENQKSQPEENCMDSLFNSPQVELLPISDCNVKSDNDSGLLLKRQVEPVSLLDSPQVIAE